MVEGRGVDEGWGEESANQPTSQAMRTIGATPESHSSVKRAQLSPPALSTSCRKTHKISSDFAHLSTGEHLHLL